MAQNFEDLQLSAVRVLFIPSCEQQLFDYSLGVPQWFPTLSNIKKMCKELGCTSFVVLHADYQPLVLDYHEL